VAHGARHIAGSHRFAAIIAATTRLKRGLGLANRAPTKNCPGPETVGDY
jgi:hypothetical protein